MNKLLVCLVLAGFIAVAFGQEEGAEKEVIFKQIEDTFFGHVLKASCAVRDLVQEPTFSEHAYKIVDAVERIIDEGRKCARGKVLDASNDKKTYLGKMVNALRRGKAEALTGFDQFDFDENSLLPIFSMMIFAGYLNMDTWGSLWTEIEALGKDILDDCAGKIWKEVDADVNYVRDALRDAIKKADPSWNLDDIGNIFL